MGDLTGKTLGRYRILERLGRGGMAEVYKGYQPALDRTVAVKVLHAFLLIETGSRERFQREAQAVATLHHPNIVQVFDYDVEGDIYFMVMEFIAGPNLKQILEESAKAGTRLSLERSAEIITAIGGALAYAHRHGLIHRDVKPHNIMFGDDGRPLLTDFGVAKMISNATLTASGGLSGTPAYMSPEQGRGLSVDTRTDIYSLGVVLYEMVTGRVPFDADTPFAIVIKHINDPLPLPRALNPAIPDGVERVILKALAKDPTDRFQTMDELIAATQAAVAAATSPAVPAVPAVPAEPPAPPPRPVVDVIPAPDPAAAGRGSVSIPPARPAEPIAARDDDFAILTSGLDPSVLQGRPGPALGPPAEPPADRQTAPLPPGPPAPAGWPNGPAPRPYGPPPGPPWPAPPPGPPWPAPPPGPPGTAAGRPARGLLIGGAAVVLLVLLAVCGFTASQVGGALFRPPRVDATPTALAAMATVAQAPATLVAANATTEPATALADTPEPQDALAATATQLADDATAAAAPQETEQAVAQVTVDAATTQLALMMQTADAINTPSAQGTTIVITTRAPVLTAAPAGDPPRISQAAFLALYGGWKTRPIILDVRSREEYDTGHIKYAMSFPEADADSLASQLPRAGMIVAYCQ